MKTRAVLLAGALALAVSAVHAQAVKVGVVNLFRLQKESPTAIRALKALESELLPRGKEIQSFQARIEAERQRLEADRGGLSREEIRAKSLEISEMMRRSDRMVEALAETNELRRREIQARVVEEARSAIQAVAEAGKFDLVLMDAAFARSSVDITPLVLKEMARRAGSR